MTRPPQNRDRCGSILMEFVLVAPLITLLVSFVLQMAHIWMARQITAYAAYCATRAVLAVRPEEQDNAAKKAAELACSWMSLVGLPSAVTAAHGGIKTKTVYIGKLHNAPGISEYETIYDESGLDISGEVEIPGWGRIPGSDSAKVRVAETEIASLHGEPCNGNGNYPIAAVTVKFKFPLVLPLAGRMISWAANHGEGDGLEKFDYGHHKMTAGNNPGWAGQQTVMNASGGAEDIATANNARSAGGKYPFMTLTETCILPMPYSTARFPQKGYDPGGGL